MPDYLLPCTCGQKTVVSAVQAGETVRCACGAALVVPSMRGLREMEPADEVRKASRPWEDRHRGAFLLIVAAAACLLLIAYLAWTLPAGSAQTPETPGRVHSVLDAFREFVRLDQGLERMPIIETPNDKSRKLMLWGMGIAFVAAVCALGGAVLVLAVGRRRR